MIVGVTHNKLQEELLRVSQDFSLPLNIPSFNAQTTTFKWEKTVSGCKPEYIGEAKIDIRLEDMDGIAAAMLEPMLKLLKDNLEIIRVFLNGGIRVFLSTVGRAIGKYLPLLQKNFKAALPASSDFMGQRFEMAVSPEAFLDTDDKKYLEKAMTYVKVPKLKVAGMVNVEEGTLTISLPDYGSSAELKPVKLEVKGHSSRNEGGQSYLSIGTDICMVTGPKGPNPEHKGFPPESESEPESQSELFSRRAKHDAKVLADRK